MPPETISFEENLEKLKEIVGELENGDMPLEKSLEKFQSSIGIVKQCYKELETAEMKIETIIKKEDKIITEPLKNK